MIKRMVIMLVLVGLVLGGIFGFQAFKGVMIKRYFATMTAPPQTVSTIKATQDTWQPKIEAVGTLVAENGADLSAEVPGIVARILFKSGEEVKEGTLLLELDADVDKAQLKSLKATQVLAQKSLERAQQLFKVNALSQAELDQAAATADSANAQVAAQSAVVDKKMIRAPFGGRLGIRAVDRGQYVNPGTKLVA
ncbi:MAG TPA: efflux RND transporter periplasmic adaptor subunit, partial [bacterium]